MIVETVELVLDLGSNFLTSVLLVEIKHLEASLVLLVGVRVTLLAVVHFKSNAIQTDLNIAIDGRTFLDGITNKLRTTRVSFVQLIANHSWQQNVVLAFVKVRLEFLFDALDRAVVYRTGMKRFDFLSRT